eukprot:CAMPEP_0170485144 /NCGR_PEP_ID=MMETSP0208-20121228/4468_1 /TAXON_ID=197538 /ORGANISM="Strombidium inclinatum, Strain S3" /LENGTH=199 /DNA_ID=CAMNT_0010758701 /DNA_START=386 /DNA_END=985 /DNA_ORIENTATION=+
MTFLFFIVLVGVIVAFIVLFYRNTCEQSLLGDTVYTIYLSMSVLQSVMIAVCTCYLHQKQLKQRQASRAESTNLTTLSATDRGTFREKQKTSKKTNANDSIQDLDKHLLDDEEEHHTYIHQESEESRRSSNLSLAEPDKSRKKSENRMSTYMNYQNGQFEDLDPNTPHDSNGKFSMADLAKQKSKMGLGSHDHDECFIR